MPDRSHIGLDNPVFYGRLRTPERRAQSLGAGGKLPVRPSVRYYNNDVIVGQHKVRPAAAKAKAEPVPAPAPARKVQATVLSPTAPFRHMTAAPKPAPAPKLVVIKPQKFATPPLHTPQRSAVLQRQVVRSPHAKEAKKRRLLLNMSKPQLALTAMAVLIFMVGLAVSAITLKTNQAASSQVAALSKSAGDQPATSDSATTNAAPGAAAPNTPPSTVRPSKAAVSNYAVGPDLPRYVDIPKLGVHARVLSLGILNSGALATPNNVFDVGWYNESSKPGQPGAMLVDGHVSSWTAHGVFYGIKNLVAGDLIKVTRGDGQVFTYQVVKHQIFDHNDVDMQSAVTPVDPSKPGLNLITCTGQVIHGTNEFNERVLVYASQV